MKTIKKISVLLIGLIFTITCFAQSNKLPEITLNDIDGKKINTADYGKMGKIVILNFWATWCVPCKKELNNISELYEDWRDNYDVLLVAVSTDDARNTPKVKTYVNGQAWEYEVLLDVNQELKRALNFQTVPFTIMIDQNGDIVYKHEGYQEGDEYILEDKIKEIHSVK